MIVRNTHGLPRALVDTVTRRVPPEDRREGADISVTELLGPPRIKQLRDRYYDEIDTDASDMLHALMGTAIHALIAKTPHSVSSLRLFARWFGFERSWNVSGEIDLIEDGILWDFKPLRAAAVFDGPKEEWVQQLNVYRMLAEENGIRVFGLKACPYIRDFTPVERFRNSKYPIASMISMDVPMWSTEKARAFIQYRLQAHEEHMPMCTMEERWQKPHEFALMCHGNQRAISLYKKREDAEYQMNARKQANPGRKFWVVERHAESLRCKHYCNFWKFCDHGRVEKLGQKTKSIEPPEI